MESPASAGGSAGPSSSYAVVVNVDSDDEELAPPDATANADTEMLLATAHIPEADRAALPEQQESRSMTAEAHAAAAAAHAAAAAEGLALLPSRVAASGFKHVHCIDTATAVAFVAKVQYHDGRPKHLGTFATAEEAALAVARFLGPERVAAARGAAARVAPALAPPVPALMTAAEAHAAAAARDDAATRRWRDGVQVREL